MKDKIFFWTQIKLNDTELCSLKHFECISKADVAIFVFFCFVSCIGIFIIITKYNYILGKKDCIRLLFLFNAINQWFSHIWANYCAAIDFIVFFTAKNYAYELFGRK